VGGHVAGKGDIAPLPHPLNLNIYTLHDWVSLDKIGPKVKGEKWQRYDDPKTPYQRVMESPHVSEKTKAALTKQLQTLNPFELRKAIELRLERIFTLLHDSKP
jgi:hypothetical protein